MTRDWRAAPPREYQEENVFQWIARQGNPIKAKPANKKKDPINAVAAAPGSSSAVPTKE